MKRLFSAICIALLIALSLVSCAAESNVATTPAVPEKSASAGLGAPISVENQELTLELSFGERTGRFTGTLVNGLPEGEGVFSSQNESGELWTYTGAFKAGHFSGVGETVVLAGASYRYKGVYQNDQLNGAGEVFSIAADGTETLYADGQFADDKLLTGTLYDYSGAAYYSGSIESYCPKETPEQNAARKAAFAKSSQPFDYAAWKAVPDSFKGKRVSLAAKTYYTWEKDQHDPTYLGFMAEDKSAEGEAPSLVACYYYGLDADMYRADGEYRLYGIITGNYQFAADGSGNNDTAPMIELFFIEPTE